jgi:succinate dehydrogenase / fumarate reductase membrane anchor subunit
MTHKGTATFIAQRLTAVLLLPLVLWFIFAMTRHAGASLDEMRAFIASPLPAAMFALLFIIGAAHMRIGLNEIIDDYAHGGFKGVWKLLNLFASLGAVALGLWGVATLAL